MTDPHRCGRCDEPGRPLLFETAEGPRCGRCVRWVGRPDRPWQPPTEAEGAGGASERDHGARNG